VAFAVGLVGSLIYLISKRQGADRVAASSIEVGVMFTALLLVTGMIWGRPTWGVWWDWGDARMVSSAFMLFFYLGYLALRRGIHDPQLRARRTAVLGIIAFAQVPVVHFSVTWFRTLHQPATLIRPDVENAPIDSEFVGPLLVGLAAFFVTYLAFTIARTRLAVRQDELLGAELSGELAGSAITDPQLGGVHG
jgi:heme exporter protein C